MYGQNLEDDRRALAKVVPLRQKACSGLSPTLFIMTRTFVTREKRRTESEH